MTDQSTHYDLLGVTGDAEPEIVKAAYKALTKKYHPDNQVTGDHARYAAINNAYTVLADPQQRADYDAQLAAVFAPPPESEPAPSWGEEDIVDVTVDEPAPRSAAKAAPARDLGELPTFRRNKYPKGSSAPWGWAAFGFFAVAVTIVVLLIIGGFLPFKAILGSLASLVLMVVCFGLWSSRYEVRETVRKWDSLQTMSQTARYRLVFIESVGAPEVIGHYHDGRPIVSHWMVAVDPETRERERFLSEYAYVKRCWTLISTEKNHLEPLHRLSEWDWRIALTYLGDQEAAEASTATVKTN